MKKPLNHKLSTPQPSFAIGIPTLNRMDLLAPALHTYIRDFSILVFDNGRQAGKVEHPQITWLYPDKNLGVAASWNRLCHEIFRYHSHAVILNDDIQLGFGANTILQAISKNPDRLITSLIDWCIFILPKTVFEKIGPFDENFFPAYYEDKDYERRIRLAGGGIIRSPLLQPKIYRDNSTAEKDSTVHLHAHKNKEYFLKKWGGPPAGEKFSVPFNIKTKN